DRLESVHGRALATLMLGETELLSGRLEAAEDALSLSQVLHREARATSGHVLVVQRLAEIDVLRDRPDDAEKLLHDAVPDATTAPLAAHLLVRVHGGLVEAAAAMDRAPAALEESDRALHGRDVCEPCSMGFLVSAAIAAARAGDMAAAHGYLARAARGGGRWRGGSWEARVWGARA